jgi:hypothetical protein
MYRRSSTIDSNDGSDDLDNSMSIVSESFESSGQLDLATSQKRSSTDKNYISGYLLKQSKEGIWQKRYFETNGTFLTYYKSKKMTKLLAALNMPNVGEITLVRSTYVSSHPFSNLFSRLEISKMTWG